ncbi:hypothetical protein D3C72_1906030 [compost metagenome]
MQPRVVARRRIDQVEIADRAVKQAAIHPRIAGKRVRHARRQWRLPLPVHGQLDSVAFQHGDDALIARKSGKCPVLADIGQRQPPVEGGGAAARVAGDLLGGAAAIAPRHAWIVRGPVQPHVGMIHVENLPSRR